MKNKKNVFLVFLLLSIILLNCTKINFDMNDDNNHEGSPVITLHGPNPYKLNVDDQYIEPGAKAIDSKDGDLSSLIEIDNSLVDESNENEYKVSYTVEDEDGYIAIKIRSVIVQDSKGSDKEKPKLTLIGDNPDTVFAGGKYTDPGAAAIDNEDGNISFKIEKHGVSFSTSSIGTHTIYYVVSDEAGNISMITRRVNIVKNITKDTEPPVIKLEGPSQINLIVGNAYKEHGATATDNVDGDITDKIKIDSDEVDTDKVGNYKVYYSVSDVAGNKTTKTRNVAVSKEIIKDVTAPIITLIGDKSVKVFVGKDYKELGATATDDIDGDITSSITIDDSKVKTSTVGTYKVYYSVSDAAGNEAKTEREVRVIPFVDNEAPIITIKGPNPINLTIGNNYNEYGAIAVDNVDDTITNLLDTNASAVNTNKVGNYKVFYTVKDAAGNLAEAIRFVNILASTDKTPPVITLKGTSPMSVKLNANFTDPGATATDNLDGNITAKIQVTGSVDTDKLGDYTLTYKVSDIAGNTATKTRIVNVVEDIDSIPPVITLNGNTTMAIIVNKPYNEPGAKALDNKDGDITSKIIITGTVNTNNIGTYTITYKVTDNAGNSATKKRTVKVVSESAPEWVTGKSYSIGDLVSYNGNTYKCISAHTSNAGWKPDTAFTLWQLQ